MELQHNVYSHLPGEGGHDGTTALLTATYTNIAKSTIATVIIMRKSHRSLCEITMPDDEFTEKKHKK